MLNVAACALAHRFRRPAREFVCLLAVFSWPASASIVSEWNKVALAEVRVASKQGPPIIARALAITHTCIYDAWAAYDSKAVGTVLGGSLRRPASERTDANMAQAISFAAYRCLVNVFPKPDTQTRLIAAMMALGYDPLDGSQDPTTPAGIGNVTAQAVIDARRNDGSNQYGDLNPKPDLSPGPAYSDYTGYAPRNRPMGFCIPTMLSCPPLVIDDKMHWQPLIPDSGATQIFTAPQWGKVQSFSLGTPTQVDAYSKYVPAPDIQSTDPKRYKSNVDDLLKYSSGLTPDQKLIVEYWADGPQSELPPGHWGLFAQFVSQRDRYTIGQDAKMFFAMHNALFDASIVSWSLKRKYDGVRPITAVRFFYQGMSVKAWGGPGRPIETIQGEKWMPYNPGSNLTPPFPGFISGHSTFSRSAATVLQLFTGSDNFGFSTVVQANFGRVELGIPLVPTLIKFATFDEAANQAGMSRLYAGIHFSDDNTLGQTLGQLVGKAAFDKAQAYFSGISSTQLDGSNR